VLTPKKTPFLFFDPLSWVNKAKGANTQKNPFSLLPYYRLAKAKGANPQKAPLKKGLTPKKPDLF